MEASVSSGIMRLNVAQKLIQSHLLEGELVPSQEIGIRIDQTLTQDATGTLVMLELECAWVCDYYAENAEKFLAPELIPTDASKSFVTFEPMGIVLRKGQKRC
ncbi:hypothetical protein MYX84_11665 [Acidobacteria bacterium AH-259-O06]|nr:hypothetical protein [Acidobacteria bacterium AH-259-O06]